MISEPLYLHLKLYIWDMVSPGQYKKWGHKTVNTILTVDNDYNET
jgi:hypothetical protein